MKQNLILWISAFVITFLAGFLQNRLSENYPISGSFGIDGKEMGYKLDKVYYGINDYKFYITTEIEGIKGKLDWKELNSDNWNFSDLIDNTHIIIGTIPHQKPLTRIEYLIRLPYNNKQYTILPGNKSVTITFLGNVPASVNFYFLFTLFGGIILAIRTGLEYFNSPGKIKTLTIFTLIFFAVNAFAFQPLKRTDELGMIGKGAVPINEIFPLSSVLLFVTWVVATALIFNTRKNRVWALIAAVITILIFEL